LPDENKYAGTDVVGRTAEVAQDIQTQSAISKTFGGFISDKVIAIKKWLGIVTRPTRGTSPLGALESVKNFKFNKTMNAMSLRDGTTLYAPDPFFTDFEGTVTLTTVDHFFPLSTESPTAENIDILCGRDGSDNKYIFQRKFWEASGLLNATIAYMRYGESISSTIKSSTVNTITLDGFANFSDVYNYCIIRNSTIGNCLYITDSAQSGADEVLTVLGNVPSNWANGNAVTVYRSFHDNYSFSPTYSTVAGRPPIALQQGNAILFSGGMGSTEGLKAIWSGYINKTFFVGALNKTGGFNYTGTYVTEAEIKSTNGITIADPSLTAISASNALPDGRWFFYFVPETDDGERGNPFSYSTPYVTLVGGRWFYTTLQIDPAQLNKRLRYLNVFMGKAPNATDTKIDWNNLFYVGQVDFLNWEVTDQPLTTWVWTETATTIPGYYITGVLAFRDIEWNNKTVESLAFHLGHTESTSTTASFSEAVFLNNRLFIAKYYDYVDVVEYLDQIRYTDFAGNGVAQLNVLNNLSGATQSTIEQGDPTSVQALRRWQDKLFILKDKSCYFINASEDISQWTLITVSNEIGCTMPRTAVVTPTMVIWCQNGEDVYGWSGASVKSLAQNWLTTFKALTLTATHKGWYDLKNKSYNFSYTNGTWYTMFLECPIPNGYVWGSNLFDDDTVAGLYSIIDASERAGTNYVVVMDTNNSAYKILYFNPSATADNAHFGIIPYFKTAESRLDEINLLKILKWYLTCTPTGGAGQLDCKLTIGSNTITYANITKTLTLHSRGVLFTSNQGRSFTFEFNTNASRATFTGLEIYDLQFDYEALPFIGDNTLTS
jgi:hypothetical protein